MIDKTKTDDKNIRQVVLPVRWSTGLPIREDLISLKAITKNKQKSDQA